MLVLQKSFVSLGLTGDFSLVNSICYSDALLGVLKWCDQSNQKQVAFSTFACICS